MGATHTTAERDRKLLNIGASNKLQETIKEGELMMSQLKKVFFLSMAVMAMFAFLATAMPVAADTIILPNDDSFTYNYPTKRATNFDNQGLLVKNTGTSYIRYTWLEFTLGTSGVSSATIKLYNTASATGDMSTALRGAQCGFDETTLTWNTQPTDSDTWTLLGTWTVNDPGWYTLDITSFYNSNRGSTVTIRVNSDTVSASIGTFFEDRENTKLSGMLPCIVTVPEPSSLLALACGCIGLAGLVRRRVR